MLYKYIDQSDNNSQQIWYVCRRLVGWNYDFNKTLHDWCIANMKRNFKQWWSTIPTFFS
jgi:hypothetical protein